MGGGVPPVLEDSTGEGMRGKKDGGEDGVASAVAEPCEALGMGREEAEKARRQSSMVRPSGFPPMRVMERWEGGEG